VDHTHPGAGTNIVLNFGNCTGCTTLLTPDKHHLDATGKEAVTASVPDAAANSAVPVTGMVNIAGGPTLSINAAPVH
jgi:hypothetical protein